jgi:hypothetical protein
MSHYKFEEESEEEPDFNIEIVSGEERNEISIKSVVKEAELADEHISDFKVESVDECTASEEYTTENENSGDITNSEEMTPSEHAKMEAELDSSPERDEIISFVRNSGRGIMKLFRLFQVKNLIQLPFL